jgi:hypothetical protein
MPFSLGENGFSTLFSVYTITGTALAKLPAFRIPSAAKPAVVLRR